MSIVAATDGSCLGNPGPAGWAWYVDDGCWAAGGWSSSTNNIAELTAVKEVLLASAAYKEPLVILADSQYVINALTKWIHGWQKKGWRKADGKPVLNRELIQEIYEAMQGRQVQFQWVNGHTGHPLNEQADTLARAAAEAFRRGDCPDSGPGWSR